MVKIKFLYKDDDGHVSGRAEGEFTDEDQAAASARVNLSERNYDKVEIWAGSRFVTAVRRADLGPAAAP